MWKDIKGYEGLYQISDEGQVKNSKGVILKTQFTGKGYKDGFGYESLHLNKNGERKAKKIHRLVAEAFLPNPNNYREVNHKDEDKTNNRVENLEWCNRKYNVNYGNSHQRGNETQGHRVNQYDLNGNLINSYYSVASMKKYGFPPSSIRKFIKENREYRGYIFRYAS